MSKQDAYFGKDKKFKPMYLAGEVAADVGIGPDGGYWLYDHGVWSPDPEVIDRRCARKLVNEYTITRSNTVERLVRHMKTTARIPASPAGVNSWYPYVNLTNVMYNWQDDEVEGHSPDYLSTIQLNVAYDVAATCPAFDKWVDDVIPGDMLGMFWEVLGYMLMTGNPKQTAVLLFGPEGTGKSTFLRVLEHMLGRQNISTESLRSLTENRFAVASLFGKLANMQGDIDSAYLKDSSVFKSLTGGDTMMAEEKHRKAFTFEPFAVPIFSANKVWRSSDDSGGYFRRWIILPFIRQVDRSKPFDEAALFAEAPGIFNKAMAALREVYNRTVPVEVALGEVVEVPAREFDVSGSAREAFESFTRDSDPLRMWLADDGRVSADPGNTSMRTNRTEVFETYRNWCYTNGVNPKSAPEFYKSMKALRYGLQESNGQRYLLGIRLHPATSEAWA